MDGSTGLPSPSGRGPQREHLVVGGGLTGLATAWFLGQAGVGERSLLVERGERLGGACGSQEGGGYTFDTTDELPWCEDADVRAVYRHVLGGDMIECPVRAAIRMLGRPVPQPWPLGLHALPPAVRTECLLGLVDARIEQARSGQRPQDAADFDEALERAWGSGLARHFARAYHAKRWVVPLTELDAGWGATRAGAPLLPDVLAALFEPASPEGVASFAYPRRGGLRRLSEAFERQLRCETWRGSGLQTLQPQERRVQFDDGRVIDYGTLVSTLPLPVLVDRCGEQAPPEVRQARDCLRSTSVRLVHLGVAASQAPELHWIDYPDEGLFHRVLLPGQASPHNVPHDRVGYTCVISYGPGRPLPCDGEALIERVVEDCRRVGLIVGGDRIEQASQVDRPAAHVVCDHARADAVATIRAWCSRQGIVLAGPQGEWEDGGIDTAVLSAQRAAAESIAAHPPVSSRSQAA